MIMIFDCETILDIDLIKAGFKQEFLEKGLELESLSELEISQYALEIQKELSGSAFLPVCYHCVVSIAAVICDEFGNFIKVGNFKSSGDCKEEREKSLLQDFFKFFNQKQPKLVSYNGRGFDIPMLLLRAMKHRLNAVAYFEDNNPQFNKNKWENYRQRYSERFHTDLLDSLSNFGVVRGLKLDILANLVGFPGKYDTSGDMVLELYYKNELEKINEYCQSDVLNTYGLYLNYELLRGNLTKDDYYKILENWRDLLPQEAEYYQVFYDKITNLLESRG
ncbi:MAG: 3'-5' exonuclease [Helicobacteraceae bacterium]|nr:3'-5' exonuclease [Helicobacteraceae bacterium]